MNEPGHEPAQRMERLLRQYFPPTSTRPRAALERDLWPAMLHRMEPQPVAVPWFDWALLAALGVCLAVFPRAIPVLLYHL
jgi:hypothetical protein